MKNSSLNKLRGLLAVKGCYLFLLMAVVGFLLAVPSSAFAKPRMGIKPSATIIATTTPIATTAIFIDISQDTIGKFIYPHDIRSTDLKPGDMLDFTVNSLVGTGKYEGNNQVLFNGHSLKLMFTNNVKLPPPILDLQPLSMSFVGSRDCQQNMQKTAFVCLAKVSSRKDAQSNLNWIPYADFSNGVTFNPPYGSLPPGQSVTVQVSVPINACTPGLFYFQGLRNTHTISWACNPKPVGTP